MNTKTETKAASTRIQPLLFLYDTHTGLFPNVIDGISDKDAHNRLNTKANHVAWLTGSLVQQRVEIANLLGADIKQAAHELFKDYKGIQDNVTYPPLKSFNPDWDSVTPVLRELLENVSDEKLDSIFEMHEMSMPYFELIAFFIHREAYLIGQIGLWRRIMGYEPMKYQ
ncbi:MAG: DinB family protein [Chlorobi bacterium]|nr:DinB family protein [Chlorobiota bacterium]